MYPVVCCRQIWVTQLSRTSLAYRTLWPLSCAVHTGKPVKSYTPARTPGIWTGAQTQGSGIWHTPTTTTGITGTMSFRASAAEVQRGAECRRIREHALDMFSTSIESVYPPRMIQNALAVSQNGNILTVEGKRYEMKNNVYVVGFGKAVSGMARALEDLVGSHLVRGIISVPKGSQDLFKSIGKQDLCIGEDSKITVHEGAEDNMPDAASYAAAMAIVDLVQSLTEHDILIVLISGGGSALLPSPEPPVSLQDELTLTRTLSKNGASIQQLNVLRQNVEILKGGGLAQLAKPASVVSLILSDVIEDKLDIISSGPTVPLLSSPRQCLQILDSLNVKDKVPEVIVTVLQEKARKKKSQEEAAFDDLQRSYSSKWDHVHNVIIGSNGIATQAAALKASDLGYVPMILTTTLQGDAKMAAEMFVKLAMYMINGFGNHPPDKGVKSFAAMEIELLEHSITKDDLKMIMDATKKAYNSKKSLCIICGGETTVRVTGSGKGGRNQEMALAFALQYEKLLNKDSLKALSKFHVEFLSGGTDGQDGPTDAAGAVVNKNLVSMAISSGLVPQDYLTNNDSYSLFKHLSDSGCLIQTGLTGTNVMDIQLLIVGMEN